MTDYRIEAATKEEWAERALSAERKLVDTAIGYKKRCEVLALRAERKLANTVIGYKKRCGVLEERWEAACQDAEEAEVYAGKLEKACAEWAEVSQSNYQRAKSAEAKLAAERKRCAKVADHLENILDALGFLTGGDWELEWWGISQEEGAEIRKDLAAIRKGDTHD